MAKASEQLLKIRELKAKLREAERLAGGGDTHARHRDSAAEWARESSAKGREIGPLPPVKDPARRAACREDSALFAKTYFPDRFPLPFCRDHLDAFRAMQACSEHGGRYARAMMRGGGKTTSAEVEALRALLYGLRRFLVLIQATQPLAALSLAKIQRALETNDLLLEDFPEVCFPIRALERIHNRARGQTQNRRPTNIQWKGDGVVLPTIAGSVSSGAVIHVTGITGAFRGLNMVGPDGEIFRPDLVILDDCQTRDSAKSPTQTADREAIITDDVLALAGPTTEIAAVMLCTPIFPNDLSERFLDPEKHPDWNSQRGRMLRRFPDRMDLWDRYAELRKLGQREGDRGAAATEFYREHRADMDAGADVTWPERKKPGELSGLQSAMNLFVDNPRGFRAEYQCEPEAVDLGFGIKELGADQVAARLSGTERYQVPAESTRLTAFIDCGKALHWFGVVAWTERFGGTVIDYGPWPRQARSIFAAGDARPSIAEKLAELAGTPLEFNEEQIVYAGLERVVAEVMGRTYYRVGGGELRIEACLIDSGNWTKTVYQFVQRNAKQYGWPLYPSKGIARTTTARGVSEWKPRPGERKGYHWRLTTGEYSKVRAVQFDPDPWKSFIHLGMTTPAGGPTGLFLYGTSAAQHAMIGEHCAAEYGEPQTIRGTTFDKWQVRVHRPDNHLLDVLVGCAVAASLLGIEWSATADGKLPPRRTRGPRKDWAELQRERKAGK
jgi:hypothetical protein